MADSSTLEKALLKIPVQVTGGKRVENIYLSKGAFPNEGVNFISVEELFAIFNDIIVVIVVISVVKYFPLLFMRRVFLTLLCSPLLFRVINLQTNK